jgi:hypothetical protein
MNTKSMTYMTRFILFFGLLGSLTMLLPGQTRGQEPFDLDEIKVIAPYEPTISDAFKIALNPRIDDTTQVRLAFDYEIRSQKLITPFTLEPIAPARMRGEPLDKLYRGLVKGGYGTYSTPYFEGFFNSLRSNNHSLGIHLRHMSSGGGIEDRGFSGYSDNLAHVYGKRFFRNHSLDGNLKYERNGIHYYGYDPQGYPEDHPLFAYVDTLGKGDISQVFNRFSGQLGFGTHHADSTRLRQHYSLGYHWLFDSYDAGEHHASFRGQLGSAIKQDPFGMADKQYFSLGAQVDYYNNTTALDTLNTFLISLEPKIWSKYGIFSFQLGVNTSFELDSVSFFRAYPVLGAEVKLAGDVLVAHAGFSGGLKKHSMYSMTTMNPFVNTMVPLKFMNVKSDIGGGIRGSVSDFLSYNLSVNNAVIDNHPFFVTDTTQMLNNQFTVVYDNIKRFNARGELLARFHERFSTRFSVNYFQYMLTDQIEAWHTPTLMFSMNIKYNIQEKIILTADGYTRNQTFARMFDDQGSIIAREVHGFHLDASLGIEYRYSRLLSIFLNFNNISNDPLERWLNYPSQKFNFLGGVTYSF